MSRQALLDILSRTLGEPSDCALLLYRDSHNIGDAAIWLGASRALNDLGFRVRYSAPRVGFSASALRHFLPEGPIFISGGGSLGTVWEETQLFKENIINSFPDRKIVILPQSGKFSDEESLQRFCEVAVRHPDLTLLCRDLATRELATELPLRAELAPDLAMYLAGAKPFEQGGSANASGPVRLLERTDAEAPVKGSGTNLGVDWPEVSPTSLQFFAMRGLRRLGAMVDSNALVYLSQCRKATVRTNVGARFLAGSSVTVTNRLHGMVFSHLLAIPCFVADNSWGKVRAFYDTWYATDSSVQFFGSLEDAYSAAVAYGKE